MASVKAALLDQLPYNLRPKIKFFSRFRLRFVGLPVILLFLIFLCSNFPSKKTYLLRPTINAFEADSSYTVVSTLSTSVIKSLNATNESSENATMAVSDGIGEHTHLTNLSLSLEMKNGVQETLVHGQTLVANTTRSPETIPSLASKRSEAVAVRNSSFDGGEGRISFGNLRPEEGKIGNSSDGSEIRPSNSSFHVGNSRPEEGKVGNSSDRVENQVSNSSFHGGDGMVIVGNLRHAKGKMGNLSDRGEIPLSYYGTQLAKKGSPSIDLSRSCNIFDGNWVRNESNDTKPYYPPGSCPYVDRDFDCFINGRPDDGFVKWRWQPTGCNLPRLNATDFLERLRGKKLVFVGDSLNRNMWESLVCILRQSIRNKKKVYEISGRTEFKKKGFYAFRFEDYNCSVDFVGSPFLVRESAYRRGNGTLETLRLDLIDRTAPMYQDADILVFNTGHWWTHEKTSRGEDYYQEGNHVHPRLKVLQAYTKALTTWSRWVDDNINPNKTLVFFRGYSITHFRGGQWNSGGQCHKETEPIFNETYLGKYPSKMRALDFVLQGMKTPVIYLNISRMTDYRKDGHPSIYRKAYATAQERVAAEQSQDCSHWCLPGVPDTWNELLYASLRETNKEGLR